MSTFFSLLAGFFATVVSTPVIIRLAKTSGFLDCPDGKRKRHHLPRPLLGGVAVLIGLTAGIATAVALGVFPGSSIKLKYLIGLLLAMTVLVFGGAWDDVKDISPIRQFFWPVLAVVTIIVSGIGVTYITNPLGGQIILDKYTLTVLWWNGIPYKVTLLADLFTVAWLIVMTYTTKFLDGVDGLVSGVVVIGGVVVAAVSMMRDVSQPDTASLALLVSAVFFGFLLFNFSPARIFLGEGGSTLAGFLLGVLAIVSGGKIATTLLILGLPLFDAIAVVIRRILARRSPVRADRSHLHFRLLDIGFSDRQAVLLYYLVAALFGSATVFLKSGEKIIALCAIVVVVILVGWSWTPKKRKIEKRESSSEI